MLRNRMLGGVSSLALFAPETGAGAGAEGEDKHTDVVLQELAAQAFDQVAAAEAAETAGKAAGEPKPPGGDKGAAEDGKTSPAAAAADDRGDGRARNGQFARKPAAKAGEESPDTAAAAAARAAGLKGDEPGKAAAAEKPDAAAAAAASAMAPGSFSPATKAAWAGLPEHVRQDILKREAEVSAGFKEFEGLKPFAARAKQGGQTLAQALSAYTGIEELVRRDIGGGLMHIAQNAGLTQAEAGQMFGKLAQRLGFQFQAPPAQTGGGSPADQNAGADPKMLQDLLKPVLEPLMQRLSGVETTFTRQAEGARTQRAGEATRVVDAFRQSPEGKFYDNVEPVIGNLLERGLVQRTGDFATDLKAAYDMACRMDPEISDLLFKERTAAAGDQRTQEQQAAQRARQAARSVTGAPNPGAREHQARRGPVDPLQAAAEQAFDQVAARV